MILQGSKMGVHWQFPEDGQEPAPISDLLVAAKVLLVCLRSQTRGGVVVSCEFEGRGRMLARANIDPKCSAALRSMLFGSEAADFLIRYFALPADTKESCDHLAAWARGLIVMRKLLEGPSSPPEISLIVKGGEKLNGRKVAIPFCVDVELSGRILAAVGVRAGQVKYDAKTKRIVMKKGSCEILQVWSPLVSEGLTADALQKLEEVTAELTGSSKYSLVQPIMHREEATERLDSA